jgi:hypothetical protein
MTIVKRKNGIAKANSRRDKPLISDSGTFRLLSTLGTTSVFQSQVKPQSSEEKRSNQQALIKAFVEQVCLFGGRESAEVLVAADSKLWTELPIRRERSEKTS